MFLCIYIELINRYYYLKKLLIIENELNVMGIELIK